MRKTTAPLAGLLLCLLAPALCMAEELADEEGWLDELWSSGYTTYYWRKVEGSSAVSSEYPRFAPEILLDGRLYAAKGPRSWLDGSLGKSRYGPSDDYDAKAALRLSHLHGSISGKLHPDIGAYARVAVDSEPEPQQPKSRGEHVDLLEAFLEYAPPLTRKLQLRSRAGVFFPELSLENKGPAWSPDLTITPSAINSWIGEELRTVGIEGKLEHTEITRAASVHAAVFGYNDPAGAELAWRGWAFGDGQTGVRDRLPFDDIEVISAGGRLEQQVPWTEPFTEVDDRAGYYAGAALADHRYARLSLSYYDNRGDASVFDGQQYAWATRFVHSGLELPVARPVDVRLQVIDGSTRMGDPLEGGSDVAVNFRAAYLLASYGFGSHRLSARADLFEVKDIDGRRTDDDNEESGHSFTIAYLLDVATDQRLGVELLRIESDRNEREKQGLDDSEGETIFQISYRLLY